MWLLGGHRVGSAGARNRLGAMIPQENDMFTVGRYLRYLVHCHSHTVPTLQVPDLHY